jgi:hypothetical protein
MWHKWIAAELPFVFAGQLDPVGGRPELWLMGRKKRWIIRPIGVGTDTCG